MLRLGGLELLLSLLRENIIGLLVLLLETLTGVLLIDLRNNFLGLLLGVLLGKDLS